MSGWGSDPLDAAGNIRAGLNVPGTSAALGTTAAFVDGANNAPARIPAAAYAVIFNGATWDRLRGVFVVKSLAAVAVVAGTPVAIWTPQSGKKFRLLAWDLSLSVAGAIIFKDGAAEFARTSLGAAGVGKAAPEVDNFYPSIAANNVLNVDATASGSITGFVCGTEE